MLKINVRNEGTKDIPRQASGSETFGEHAGSVLAPGCGGGGSGEYIPSYGSSLSVVKSGAGKSGKGLGKLSIGGGGKSTTACSSYRVRALQQL